MSTTIVAREVKKSFSIGRGSKRRVADVLRGVSLRVESGEMVGIVGPSGSGKSTLLYCLSGLEAADSGSIQMMGTQMVHAGRNALSRTRRDHVGFIFQSYNLIPSLSAGENVSLPARLAGRPITKAQTRLPKGRTNPVRQRLSLLRLGSRPDCFAVWSRMFR